MPPVNNNQCIEWVDTILKSGVNLTTWEQEFIESMETKIEMYGDRTIFTPNMATQIERIYTERVP